MTLDGSSSSRNDLQPLMPQAAMEDWLDVQSDSSSPGTVGSYRRRVRQFVEWCAEEGIMNLNDLRGQDIKAYRDHRRPRLNDTSLKNELRTVRQFLQFAVAMEAVEPALPEAISQVIPSLTKGEESSDTMIEREQVHAILDYLDDYHYASRDHALFILLWDTGARISGVRALDVDDFDPAERTVTFRNRPESDTRLKNGASSERMNVLSERTVDVLSDYIRNKRSAKTDDYGREPLFTTRFGRASKQWVRRTTYRLTQPCFYSGCPHDEDPETCQYREHSHLSKCPSSLSPHPIRTGRITDLRNRGVRISHVAGRVDAIPETIRVYYDKPDLGQNLDRRSGAISDTGL
ncbi:tyrosine-type recombinase/integrase [Haloplanus aerogenes]|uniref:Site-specific integrase n=2 Tax=Haloplanus aerogenes TaxID=660522 RepID=A0A3G8QWA1_9EURY|nr:site-specific integrase [Haloplanus aerogenes]AZH26853.1 site-specific integrase [Haloplanus aerogenes]